MAAKVQRALSCSRRVVCRWLGINRSTLRYQPKPVPQKKQLLEAEIIRMSREHPPLGYKKIAAKLRGLGNKVNKKHVQRVRREEGLQISLHDRLAVVARDYPRAFHRRHPIVTMSGPGTLSRTTPNEEEGYAPST